MEKIFWFVAKANVHEKWAITKKYRHIKHHCVASIPIPTTLPYVDTNTDVSMWPLLEHLGLISEYFVGSPGVWMISDSYFHVDHSIFVRSQCVCSWNKTFHLFILIAMTAIVPCYWRRKIDFTAAFLVLYTHINRQFFSSRILTGKSTYLFIFLFPTMAPVD